MRQTESIAENTRCQEAKAQMSHYHYLFPVEQECELSPEAVAAFDFHQQSLSSLLGSVWQLLKSTFMNQSGFRVWREYEDSDKFFWYVYNPLSGQSRCFEDEDDARMWIEQVYYRS